MFDISQVDLMGSSICDFRCKYCFLHQNKSFNEYDKILQQAWIDGTYINNIKKVFKELDNDPLKVVDLQIWGGEPLIRIENWLNSIKELMLFMPNLSSIMIPTNWYNPDIESLCKMLQIINDTITPRTESTLLHFHIQTSIDGIPDSEILKEGHYGDWNKYKQNFDLLCSKLKHMSLPNLSIDFVNSATASDKLWFKTFKNYDSINEFLIFWNKVVNYIEQEIKKISGCSIQLNSFLNMPTIALPNAPTIEEGMELGKITRLMDYIQHKENVSRKKYDYFTREFFGSDGSFSVMLPNHDCPEADQGTVTILHDGTIAFCPSGYMEHMPEYQQEMLNNGLELQYKISLLFAQHAYNPITATKEETEKYKWYVLDGGIKDSYFAIKYYNFAMGQELALSRQIDYNFYLSPSKLLNALHNCTTIGECRRENLNFSYINCLTDQNLMRLYFNGYQQFAVDVRKSYLNLFIKHKMLKEEY